MARHNTRYLSSTPGRESNTLVDNTPNSAQSSAYVVQQPSPTGISDKENQPTPTAGDKTRGRMLPPSASLSRARQAKRMRLEQSQSSLRASGNVDEEEEEEDEDHFDGHKYYNPDQNAGERQALKRQSRALEREFNDNRDVYLRADNDGLERTINQANQIFEGVKQTSDATLDSRLLVNVSDLLSKKSVNMVLGDTSTGLDLDEFVSKCISFMKRDPVDAHGNPDPSATQRRQRRRREEDDEGDEVQSLDWAALGARAAFPSNLRPPVPGFLLGPLSVQKKARVQTQRRARQTKETAGKEVRPEALTKDDLGQTENNTLTVICSKIKRTLQLHCERAERAAEAAGALSEGLMREYRVAETGGPNLFDFIINPTSFGQTVENMFYVSFLIKEGNVGIDYDSQGEPTLIPVGAESDKDKRSKGSNKHQAVFSIDYRTWHMLIRALDIETPLIENREEQSTQIGGRGWYA